LLLSLAAIDVDCWLLVLLLLRLSLIVEPLSRQTVMVTIGGWTIDGRPVERPTHLLSSSVCSGGQWLQRQGHHWIQPTAASIDNDRH
jgi:hypothetical protein